MPFRWRISLFVMLALVVALLAQFLLGTLLFDRALTRDLRADLERYAQAIAEGLEEGPRGPTLDEESLALIGLWGAYGEGRARVLAPDGRTALLIGGSFPDDPRGWLRTRRALPGGYALEATMSRRSHDLDLRRYLRTSLLGLPLLVLLLGAGALLLAWRLLRPLRRLRSAVTEVAETRAFGTRVEVGSADDELAALARAYNVMMVRLEGYFERERVFTRYASHELRNPLTALRVQVDAALAGDLPAERVLPVLARELARLGALLDSLLILARDQPPPGVPLDLAELARESVDRARLQAGDVRIDVHGPAVLPLRGDRALLGRMLDNLLENALRHGSAERIELRLEPADGRVGVRVRDDGRGVPPELMPRLGTPFARSGDDAGSGLGLSVVAHIARAHGGEVRFEAPPGGGFLAIVELPGGGDA